MEKPGHVKSSLFFASLAAGAIACIFFTATPGASAVAAAATPPPTPPPISAPVTPQPNPTTLPTPSATFGPAAGTPYTSPSPPPSARKGLEGVWEVQIQHPSRTDYTHFALKQEGDALSGTYLDDHGKKYPIAGSVDGSAIRLIVSMPNGTTILMEGKLDGTTDMVGMLTMPDGASPFTASYRPKEKWIENVNASPGGISNPGGGYTPP
jgi:hypothetical protein